MRLAIPMCMFSCASPQIEGRVVDGLGQEIAGAQISAPGVEMPAQTDDAGRFVLAISPGPQHLTINHPDYFSLSVAVEVAREDATLMPTTTLIKAPKDSGLYVLNGADVLSLPTARLKRETKTLEGTKRRRYCITAPRGEALPVPPGETQFLDLNAAPWRLFKLDVDGCAYKDAKDTNGRWVVQYRDKPAVTQTRTSGQAAFSAATLDEGAYFVADWGGFFVTDPDSEEHYTGRLIRVDG
jgi:hypothetical protein